MTTGDTALSQVPERTRTLISQFDHGDVLGASRQLAIIGDAFVAMTEGHDEGHGPLHSTTRALADYLISTRGASSQAIPNGIRLMLGPALNAADPTDSDELRRLMRSGVSAFRGQLTNWLSDAEKYATAHLQGTSRILVYDYSSSVSALVRALATADRELTVVIPEARSLDGGRKYLDDWQGLPLVAHLVPDAALWWAVGNVDCVLVGSETLTVEGGSYNTIGSGLAALAARREDVPFYVHSILLKADTGDLDGTRRQVPMLDFAERLAWTGGIVDNGRPDFTFPDLDYTPPDLISGVLTDRGILAPADMASAITDTLSWGESRRV